MSKRTFYRSVYTVEILSEEPIPGDMDLVDAIAEAQNGDYNMNITDHRSNQTIDGKQAAAALIASGSDPDFFRIDEDGNDVDED